MTEGREDYGLLINQDTKLHRNWFKEMVRLLGVKVIYKYPLYNSKYNLNGEYDTPKFSEGICVGVIFQDHEDQKTARLLGWNAELVEHAAIIHVPYDLCNLQPGCLFEIPSAYDDAGSRLFRLTKMSGKMIYPASIACEVVPEWADTLEYSDYEHFGSTDFNLLKESDY